MSEARTPVVVTNKTGYVYVVAGLTALGGSALTMDAAVRNAVELLNVPLHAAVRMATSTPAAVRGLSEKGRISAGADADLVLLSGDGVARETIVAGEIVHELRKEAP